MLQGFSSLKLMFKHLLLRVIIYSNNLYFNRFFILHLFVQNMLAKHANTNGGAEQLPPREQNQPLKLSNNIREKVFIKSGLQL